MFAKTIVTGNISIRPVMLEMQVVVRCGTIELRKIRQLRKQRDS